MTTGNGQRYEVHCSGAVAKSIKQLQIGASPALRKQIAVAFQKIVEKLQVAAHEVGEELYRLPSLKIGVPAQLIGDIPLGGGLRRAFHPNETAGGGVTIGVGICVDSGIFNPELLGDPAVGGAARAWARARLRDRIDAVIAHEYQECIRGTDAAARQHAPTTVLRISAEARAILGQMVGP
jgi:hypothetical protein